LIKPDSEVGKNFLIRPWSKKDFLSVRSILIETWLVTYNFIPEVDLRIHLENFYSIKKLNELFKNENTHCFCVEFENNIIGWMKLFDNKVENRFYVSSLYVLPDYQGYGIGKKLMLLAEEKAVELNHSEIWIGVMEQNINTLNWYRKLGFNFVTAEPFRMGSSEVVHLIGFKSIKS